MMQARIVHFVRDARGQRFSSETINDVMSGAVGVVVTTASLGKLRNLFRKEMTSLRVGADNLNVKVRRNVHSV